MRLIPPLLLLTIMACAAQEVTPQAREVSGERALKHVATQVGFGPRVPGTPAHAKMAKWLDSVSRLSADTVIVQHWWHHTANKDSIPQYNIMARFKPELKDRILYLAHWDSRPFANGSKMAIAGANDGGSGVAVLLSVGEALKKLPPNIGVDLLYVDGEDYAEFTESLVDVLIGSTYYVAHPIVAEKPRFAILFDMVGAYDLKLPIETNSQISAPDVIENVWGIAKSMGYGNYFPKSNSYEITDDHIPFIKAGYKIIDLIPDIQAYRFWHTLDDTYDKISPKTLEAVGNVAVAVIRSAVK